MTKLKNQTSSFYKGKLYYTAEPMILNKSLNFKNELKKAKEYDLKPFILTRGVIIPNKEFGNNRLKFDFDCGIDSYTGNFDGFLYRNNKISGKMKWSVDAKLEDDIIDGYYYKKKESKIIICGLWDANKRGKNYFVIEI